MDHRNPTTYQSLASHGDGTGDKAFPVSESQMVCYVTQSCGSGAVENWDGPALP